MATLTESTAPEVVDYKSRRPPRPAPRPGRGMTFAGIVLGLIVWAAAFAMHGFSAVLTLPLGSVGLTVSIIGYHDARKAFASTRVAKVPIILNGGGLALSAFLFLALASATISGTA